MILRFPPAEPITPPRGAEVQPSQGRRSLDVLVVDDDELVQTSMAILLETLGYRFTTSASGEEALCRLQVLDPTLPVLVSTGRADQAVLDLVAGKPQTALLAKPFTLEILGDQLDALIRPC